MWSNEEPLYVPVEDYVLAGTLLLPAGDPPYPAVMLCHHADTHQRDYYRLFAQYFVQQGIAAFIYDKRGWGESSGTALFSQIAQLADDAVALYRALQRHPAVRTEAIGIWGISNGAWVAALTAAQVGQAAFVIGASLAGVTPARQEQIRRVNVVRELGASPRAADLINALWQRLFRFYVDGQWNDELEMILQQVYGDEELQRLPKHPEHGPHLQPVPPGIPIEEIKTEYGRAWPDGGFDPAPVYAGLSCPILCIWGAEDNVVPLQEGIERMRAALQSSGHSDYDLRVIPEATHKLYAVAPEPAGILSEVMHTHLHNTFLAPGGRELMAEWARRSLDHQ
jgi:pimeloyl-ACP methyl ester carboxylesterase